MHPHGPLLALLSKECCASMPVFPSISATFPGMLRRFLSRDGYWRIGYGLSSDIHGIDMIKIIVRRPVFNHL